MTPEERIDRIEKALDRHIELVGQNIVRIEQSLDRHIELVGQSIVRIEQSLDRHIEFVGHSLDRLAEQVNRTAAAQEVTEKRLQELITHVDRVDGRVKRLEDESN